MAEELGKIEKPPVEKFTNLRKLIMVPLVFSGKDAPADFTEIFNRCWKQIDEQIVKLETNLGNVSRVYHEMIFNDGEEGLKILEQLSPESFKVVSVKYKNGAKLQGVEDAELAMENMDWERCLMVAMGQKVRSQIAQFHIESGAKRYRHISQRIDETLKDREIGLIFVREGHSLQFPQSIEVLNVYPIALDELNRWLRDFSSRANARSQEA